MFISGQVFVRIVEVKDIYSFAENLGAAVKGYYPRVPLGDDSEDGEGGPSQLGSGPGSTDYVNHGRKDEAGPHKNKSLALMSDICKIGN